MIISAVPDHITLSFKDFIKHFFNLFTFKKYEIYEEHNDFIRIYGYSCRTLFELCMMYYSSINENKITATGLQHTSFKNIINKYIDDENLYVFEYSNNIKEVQKQNIESNLVLITHLFGQDLNLSFLQELKNNNPNMIIIEDRVQGGTLNKIFSYDFVDISIYSMGMDKRPNSLGGGFINIRKKYKNKSLINHLITKTNTLQKETRIERFFNLCKKIPTFLIYNYNLFTYPLIYIISIINRFNNNINTGLITSNYRKVNPGFSHDAYMKQPSFPLLKSIKENINNHSKIEKIQSTKNNKYMSMLSSTIKNNYYPWYNGSNLLTNYNTIYMNYEKINNFINMCNNKNICIIKNPTYKPLNKKHETLYNNLIYLPSLNTLNDKEMNSLIKILDN